MRKPARRLQFALLIAASAALPAPVSAQSVVKIIQGKVNTVQAGNATVAGQLALHGVQQGAAAELSYTLDAAVPGFAFNGYMHYPDAITAMSVTVGTWHATLLPSPIQPGLDLVEVGNDQGTPVGDTYLLSAPGADTDRILAGADPEDFVGMIASFGDSNLGTVTDNGVVQDPTKFLLGLGTVSGPLGHVSILLNETPGNGGGGSKGPGLAQKGQLGAASRFGRSLLALHAKAAAIPPDADPFGAKLAAGIDAAEEKFAESFKKATDKAVKKGGTAPLPASGQASAASNLEGNVQPLVESVLTGADADVKADRTLRGKLLKAAAAQCRKELLAYGADALKPSPNKLSIKLSSARAALKTQVSKAIEAAAKKGVAYAGPDGDQIADKVHAMTTEFDLLTQGVAPLIAAAAVNARTGILPIGDTAPADHGTRQSR